MTTFAPSSSQGCLLEQHKGNLVAQSDVYRLVNGQGLWIFPSRKHQHAMEADALKALAQSGVGGMIDDVVRNL